MYVYICVYTQSGLLKTRLFNLWTEIFAFKQV